MNSFSEFLLNLFFPQPRICIICGKKTNEIMICPSCEEKLKQETHTLKQCTCCGTFGYESEKCRTCFDWPEQMTNHCLFPYHGRYREVLLEYKFQNKPWLAQALANALPLIDRNSVDIVIAVPISKNRQYERGYNQSELIAKNYAKRLNIPYEKNVIQKVIDLPPQSTLNRTERLQSLNNAFHISQPQKVEGKRVLLVDDIITTGTTLKTCANLCYLAGATQVQTITVAASIQNKDFDFEKEKSNNN